MTLRQTIQAAPAKTTELITKLAATSNHALKTRESLFADLTEELTCYVEIEEQHFLPLLRKQSFAKTSLASLGRGVLLPTRRARPSIRMMAQPPR